MSRSLHACVLIIASTIPSVARGGSVKLDPPTCPLPWLDVEALGRLLSLEVQSSTVATATVSLASTSCEPNSEILTVETEAHAPLELRLGAIPFEARARAAALSIFEYIRSPPRHDPPPQSDPAPEPDPARRQVLIPPPSPADSAGSDSVAGPRVFLGPAVRVLPGLGEPFYGVHGGAAFSFRRELLFELRIGASIELTKAPHPLGELDIALFSATATLLAVYRGDGLVLGAGPRLEPALARAHGIPAPGAAIAHTHNAFVLLAAIDGVCGVRITGPFWAHLELGAGDTLRSFEALASAEVVTGVRGFFVDGLVALGVDL